MDVTHRPSPNFGPRALGPVDMLVLHYTGMQSGQAALDRLCDPNAQVSAHYLIDEDGRLFALVDESQRAWHAGLSFWRGQTDINSRSVGIELVNPGHDFGLKPYPPAQIATLIELAGGIIARHSIPARNVVGHSDIAPTRKSDPGELFDWPLLAGHGIGLWPEVGQSGASAERLADWGYDIGDRSAAITAFQRHFRPHRVDGCWDEDCALRLNNLLTSV